MVPGVNVTEDRGSVAVGHANKTGEDAMENVFFRPAPETAVESLVRATGGRCLLPVQAFAGDLDDATDDPLHLRPKNFKGGGGKVGFDTENWSSVSQKRKQAVLAMRKCSLIIQNVSPHKGIAFRLPHEQFQGF